MVTQICLDNILEVLDQVYLTIFFFDNPGNPDTPERTRLAPKYTSAEGILESRLFHPILIDGGQRGQSSLKTTGPSSLGCLPDYLVLL